MLFGFSLWTVVSQLFALIILLGTVGIIWGIIGAAVFAYRFWEKSDAECPKGFGIIPYGPVMMFLQWFE